MGTQCDKGDSVAQDKRAMSFTGWSVEHLVWGLLSWWLWLGAGGEESGLALESLWPGRR